MKPKKLLALCLAVAMTFSTQSMAFAKEKANEDAVIEEAGAVDETAIAEDEITDVTDIADEATEANSEIDATGEEVSAGEEVAGFTLEKDRRL